MTTTNTQTKQKIVNQINVTQLGETIHQIRQDPQIAQFIPKAKNEWAQGTLNKATINDYFIAKENMQRKEAFEIDHDDDIRVEAIWDDSVRILDQDVTVINDG